jgi:hypothetical protein
MQLAQDFHGWFVGQLVTCHDWATALTKRVSAINDKKGTKVNFSTDQ